MAIALPVINSIHAFLIRNWFIRNYCSAAQKAKEFLRLKTVVSVYVFGIRFCPYTKYHVCDVGYPLNSVIHQDLSSVQVYIELFLFPLMCLRKTLGFTNFCLESLKNAFNTEIVKNVRKYWEKNFLIKKTRLFFIIFCFQNLGRYEGYDFGTINRMNSITVFFLKKFLLIDSKLMT